MGGGLTDPESSRVSNDESRSPGLSQFRNSDGVPAQKVFNLARPVIAILKPDHPRRCAAGTGEVEKIGIGRDDGKPVRPGIFPNSLVRREPGETRVENVDRVGKELGETANQLRREIRVKQKFQCDARSRPVCEAYA